MTEGEIFANLLLFSNIPPTFRYYTPATIYQGNENWGDLFVNAVACLTLYVDFRNLVLSHPGHAEVSKLFECLRRGSLTLDFVLANLSRRHQQQILLYSVASVRH